MRLRWWILLATVALALPAAGQSADVTVSQENVTSSAEVQAGSSVSFDVDVNLTAQGFTCASDIEVPVNVTMEADVPDSPASASVTTTDAELVYAIPQGAHELEPYTEVQTASVQADTDGGVEENYTATLTVASAFPGATYDSCAPSEFPPAESDPAEIELQVTRDQVPEPDEDENDSDVGEEPTNDTDTNDTDDPGGTGDEGEDESNGIPAPGALAPAALAVAAAGFARGRRED